MKWVYLFFVLLLVGCSEILPESTLSCPACPECKPVREIVEVYDTTKAKVVYVNTTPTCVNKTETITVPEIRYVDSSNTSYVINLIRQLKYCESRINYSDIFLKDDLEECNATLHNIKEQLE